ncbi:NEDD4-binding protein 2-like 1 isoform X2 [Conger conger]|uniref:NEDD4-binding protein 2-like 1 isoform X2 n=1 Tax=Conger conger TaxID=82655 RepID=UPI002A59CF9A|nr:NEDD4-binding protein 2-like 1 isoform X2 [Conger conger]
MAPRRRNRPHLIIMRGLPASGKTDLARKTMEGYGNAGFILSTDDYFINDYGHYNFDYNQLGEAHAWNQDRAEEAMRDRVHPIIIDNTNIRRRHMKPYVQMKGLRRHTTQDLTEDGGGDCFHSKDRVSTMATSSGLWKHQTTVSTSCMRGILG